MTRAAVARAHPPSPPPPLSASAARFAAACAAAEAAGAPAPVRGPAADSALGERLLDVISLVSASGFALDARPARFLCGATFRLGARRADGSLDRAGFLGGTADMIDCALRLQAPWLEAARRAPRESAQMQIVGFVSRTTSLMRAAEAGDERGVRELLAAGAPLRCVDSCRWLALHHASAPPVISALLAADTEGDTVDAQDCNSYTPLILASRRGLADAACALLAHGARPELPGDFGKTALHEAACFDRVSVIELLCAAPRAAVDARDFTRRTPLMLASMQGCEGAVRALLARGARQELQDEKGWSALTYAANNGHAGAAELLCAAPGAAAALASADADGLTPLGRAVKWRRVFRVRARDAPRLTEPPERCGTAPLSRQSRASPAPAPRACQ